MHSGKGESVALLDPSEGALHTAGDPRGGGVPWGGFLDAHPDAPLG